LANAYACAFNAQCCSGKCGILGCRLMILVPQGDDGMSRRK
jgi:hypothetical protein